MKFLCDRCKTRYSIGDDRVRGKILKIRCKNCANVITVREGMTADADALDAGRAKKATTVAPMPLPDERDVTPGREAVRPRAAGTESPGSAAGGAREPVSRQASGTASPREPAAKQPAAAAPAKKPQRSDDAARGQGKRSPAADGARGEPDNALGQAFASAMAKPPPAALEEEWYVSIDGDQAGPFSLVEAQRWVSQKPFEAELHCWNEGFDDWLPVDKVSHFRGLRKRPSSPSAAPLAPAPPLSRTGGASRPQIAPADEAKPLFAAAAAARPASPALQPSGAPRASGFDRPSAGRSNGALRNAALGAPHGAPFDTSEDSDVGTELEATRYRDPGEPRDPLRGVPPATGTPAPSGSMAAVSPPVTLGGAAGLMGAVVSAPASDFESDAHMGDDLHIGEVSRVVNLADLRPPTRPSRAPSPSGRAATFGSRAPGQGFRAPTNGGMMPGPAAALQPEASETAMAPVAKSHRRGLLVLLGVAAVMLLGVAAAVLLLVLNDEEPTGGALGQVRNIDTSRPEDPIGQRPLEPGESAPGSAKPVAPAPLVPRPVPRPNVPAEVPAGNPLRYDEIEDVARKHQDITQRCYMRSQRGIDSILVGDVKKIAVTLTIDRDGNVTDLQLSDHAADNLGKCLTTSIKAWKFRPSAGGSFRFSLNFVSG